MLVYAGTFTSVNHSIVPIQTRKALLADLNNDSHLDLIEGATSFTANRVYMNDGNGNFIVTNQTFANDSTFPIAIADLDNDGDLDYINGVHHNKDGNGGKNKIFLNDGTGIFILNQTSAENDFTSAIAIADLDNDGDLDYIAGNDDANRVYLNNNGVFALLQTSNELDKTYSIAIADLDNDGDLDYIAGNYFFPNRIYLNNGSGFFTLFESNDVFEDGRSDGTRSVALGDFNNDGNMDYVIGNYLNNGTRQHNRIYLNNGNANFVLHQNSSESDFTTSVAVGDLDNDGDLDYISGNTGMENRIYLNDGNANFILNQSSTEKDFTYSIAIGDIDNDNDLDYIAGTLSDVTPDRIYKNDESNTNNAPLPPTNINSIVNGREVILIWNNGSDTETPTNSLTYNLRVGISENKNSIFSSAIPAGMGNVRHASTKTLKNLKSGIYYYSVQTIDSGFALSSFSIEKTFIIGKPAIDSYAPTNLTPSIDENSILEFNVSVSDIDNDILSYLWKLDNADVSTTDSFTYVPDFEASGNHIIKVIISDGTSAVNQSWNVTVNNVNRAPILDLINDITVNESDLVIITANATDPDDDILIYSINDSRFSQNDNVFDWQTLIGDNGVYSVNISVNDSLLTESQIVTITVNNVTTIASFNISLNQGWNLISIPLKTINNSIKRIFSSIENNYSKILTYNSSDTGNEWRIYNKNNLNKSNLENIEMQNGIWIKMLQNDTLMISGTNIDNITYNLKQGRNLISYPLLNEKNVSVVFNQINSSLNSVLSYENNKWFSYSPSKNEFLNTLKKIRPGFGYLVNVNENASLTFV